MKGARDCRIVSRAAVDCVVITSLPTAVDVDVCGCVNSAILLLGRFAATQCTVVDSEESKPSSCVVVDVIDDTVTVSEPDGTGIKLFFRVSTRAEGIDSEVDEDGHEIGAVAAVSFSVLFCWPFPT